MSSGSIFTTFFGIFLIVRPQCATFCRFVSSIRISTSPNDDANEAKEKQKKTRNLVDIQQFIIRDLFRLTYFKWCEAVALKTEIDVALTVSFYPLRSFDSFTHTIILFASQNRQSYANLSWDAHISFGTEKRKWEQAQNAKRREKWIAIRDFCWWWVSRVLDHRFHSI